MTGQVRETSSNGVKEQQRIDNTREPAPEVQPAEAPKQQFNWCAGVGVWKGGKGLAWGSVHITTLSRSQQLHAPSTWSQTLPHKLPQTLVLLSSRFKAWYPVAIEQDLDPSLPQHAKVLGLDLAIWWDSKASTWRCVCEARSHVCTPLAPGSHTPNHSVLPCNAPPTATPSAVPYFTCLFNPTTLHHPTPRPTTTTLYRAFQDRCPHRLAPLSEGIVDAQSGDLYCNYHGCELHS